MRSGWTSGRIGLALLAWMMVLGSGRAIGDIESTPLGQPSSRVLVRADTGSDTKPVIESQPIGGDREGGADPFAFSAYVQTLLALGLVLGLAVAISILFKRFARTRGGLFGALGPGGPSPSGVLEILGRYPIGAGQSLVLLRFDTRVVLLHQVGGRKNPSVRTISEVCDADEVASIMMKTRDATSDAADASFRETIRNMERGFGEAGRQPAVQAGPKPSDEGSAQQQIDLLVGDGPAAGGLDVRAIRGRLRGWVGAGS